MKQWVFVRGYIRLILLTGAHSNLRDFTCVRRSSTRMERPLLRPYISQMAPSIKPLDLCRMLDLCWTSAGLVREPRGSCGSAAGISPDPIFTAAVIGDLQRALQEPSEARPDALPPAPPASHSLQTCCPPYAPLRLALSSPCYAVFPVRRG